MNKTFLTPRGTTDILPEEIALWHDLEAKSRDLLFRFGYHEIRTPLFEETELFARSMGQTSDIVQKQMLQLKSQKDDVDAANFALRPEGTAAIVRSYIENELDKKEALSKLFYMDCKNRDCKSVVARLNLDHSYLSDESRQYFAQVCEALESLHIKYEINQTLVRGLDYYTHTVFEISCPALGSQDALGAGGRYSGLVAQLGGPQVDAIGFALGIERVLLALGKKTTEDKPIDVVFVSLDESVLKHNFILSHQVREAGFSAAMSYRLGSMKSQMRLADKLKARYVIILGQDELNKGVVTLKNMSDGKQQEIAVNDMSGILELLKK